MLPLEQPDRIHVAFDDPSPGRQCWAALAGDPGPPSGTGRVGGPAILTWAVRRVVPTRGTRC